MELDLSNLMEEWIFSHSGSWGCLRTDLNKNEKDDHPFQFQWVMLTQMSPNEFHKLWAVVEFLIRYLCDKNEWN